MSDWVAYVHAHLRLTGLTPAREREIVEDIARQLEDAYEEALARGASAPDARAAAHRHITDWPDLAREVERAERAGRLHMMGWNQRPSDASPGPRRSLVVSMWSDLLHDVAYGFRMFRAHPGVTAVALLTLALGIGANTAIFSVVDAVMLRALPVRDPDHLVLLQWTAKKQPSNRNSSTYGDCPKRQPGANPSECSFSHPFLRTFVAGNTSFTGVAAFANAKQVSMTGHGAATLARAEYVSGDYFTTLGVPPAAGRTLEAADDAPGAPAAMVLGYAYWQRVFAGDPRIVGQTLSLNGRPFTVAGVADPRFTHLTPGYVFDLWIPLSSKPQLVEPWDPKSDDAASWWIVIVGRLKPDVGAAAAQAEATGLFRHDAMNGDTPLFRGADDPKVVLLPAQTSLAGIRGAFFSTPLDIIIAVVGAILLIACANVGGLMMARAAARQNEMAIRLSLGASRARLVRQGLTESATLAVLGGALALVLAHWTTRLLVLMMGTMAGGRDLGLNTSVDVRVFLFTLGLSLLAGILFGIAPAWLGTQVELTPALKDGSGQAARARRRLRAGSVLVVTQVALTVIVLMGAGLLVRTLQNLRSVDAGFQTTNLLTFGIDLSLARTRGTTANQLSQDLERQFAELPGIVAVSYSNDVLLARSSYSSGFSKPGASAVKAEAEWLAVGPHFFETLGLSILAGRDFRPEEYATPAPSPTWSPRGPEAPTPVLVNQMFVKTYLPTVYPIDQVFGASTRWGGGWQIVGVVSDSKYDDLRKDVVPTYYRPLGGARYFEVRTARDPASVVPSIRSIAQRMDLPLFDMKTEAQQIDELLSQERLVAQVSGFFGLLALVLASIGLYGLLSHEVSTRTREIGIRMALGAPRASVLRLVVGQGVSLGCIGVGVGAVAGIGATRYLHSLLFGVGSGDPMTLASVTALLIGVSVAACIIPARHATRVDPLAALRHE
jgi:predicted permease